MQTEPVSIKTRKWERVQRQGLFQAEGLKTFKLPPVKEGEHRVMDWISENCRFPSTAGAKFFRKKVGQHILPFQKEILISVFNPDGTVNKPGVFLYGCRKVSKSMLFSWILFYLLANKSTAGFQCPIVASAFKQGGIIFDFVREMVLMSGFKNDFKILKDSIRNKETGNKVYVVFNSPDSNFGGQASAGVFDEVGRYRDMRNMDAVLTSMSLAEDKPIQLFASNPPDDDGHFIHDMISGVEKDTDFIVKKFCAPKAADIFDPQTWRINPFIDKYFETRGQKFKNTYDYYVKEAELAKRSKEKELTFRKLLLGQSVQATGAVWLDTSQIKIAGEDIYKREDLRWSCGVDLSISADATAVCFVGYSENTEETFVKPLIYYPSLKNKGRAIAWQLRKWRDLGFIKIQKGVTDKQEIIEDIRLWIEQTGIKPEAVVFDPYAAQFWTDDIKDLNPILIKYRALEVTTPIRFMQRVCASGKLSIVGKNPAFIWHCKNALVSERSKAYCLLNRTSDWLNIDAGVASVLGLKHLIDNPTPVTEAWSC